MKLNLGKLTKLVDEQEKDTFYYKDFDHPDGGDRYRIFNYRLASFNDFDKNPMFVWCRGTMFNLRTGKVASRPMEKFFNYHEWLNNDKQIPKSDFWYVSTKHDGSLVSTYLHDGQIFLKSKFSLESEQAVNATTFIRNTLKNQSDKELKELQNNLKKATFNYEYVGPDNIIVVPYGKENVHLLNIIDNETGKYNFISYDHGINNCILDDFVEDTYQDDETLHEGYVISTKDLKQRIKIKTNRYLSAHKVKDNVNSMKNLVRLVCDGQIDDLLNCKDLEHDKEFFQILNNKAELIKDTVNESIFFYEKFYEENKELSRKDYALLVQEKDLPIGVLMNLYLGKETNYTDFFLKNLELFE